MAESIDFLARRFFASFARYRWLGLVIGGLIIVLILPRTTSVVKLGGNITTVSSLVGYPLAAVEWAKTHPDQIGSRMYNTYNIGGFLVWQFPEQKVFIDGRMSYWEKGDAFPYFDSMAAQGGNVTAVRLMEEQYGVDWAFVSPFAPLTKMLNQLPDWQLVYSDKVAAIYRKK